MTYLGSGAVFCFWGFDDAAVAEAAVVLDFLAMTNNSVPHSTNNNNETTIKINVSSEERRL